MTQPQPCLGGFEELLTTEVKPALQAKFIVPPFSILDTRQGYWQERRRLWLSLGIQSELGRGENLLKFSERAQIHRKDWSVSTSPSTGTENMASGTSLFDPVLCELIYKWFCPEKGIVFDPFAGGSVRGIVASMLGCQYYGIDLSEPQIVANIEQGFATVPDSIPHWYKGDSLEMDAILPQGLKADLVFSCPPYHDLEQYTDDPADLSNMSWNTFKEQYSKIIEKAVLRLNNNRFACFVVSEIRDDNGFYKGLVPYTIDCFKRSGMWYYNEIVLVNALGSLPIRIDSQFGSYRKVGRTHQNVLIFYKGSTELIPRYFKSIEEDMPSYNGSF